MSFLKEERGQILIESVVAITMVIVGLMGIISLILSSLRWNRNVEQKLVATYLSAEGIEVVKNIIDTNVTSRQAWNTGLRDGNYGVDYTTRNLSGLQPECGLIFSDAPNAYECTSSLGAPYVRSVSVQSINSDKILVSAKTRWVGARGEENVTVQDFFYNWRE